MNIKNLLTYLAVLTLSFNVFTAEAQEELKMTTTEQIALNQENSPSASLASHAVNSHTIPQATTEKPSELITSLSVYLIIIVVYSIYGFKANAKNSEN